MGSGVGNQARPLQYVEFSLWSVYCVDACGRARSIIQIVVVAREMLTTCMEHREGMTEVFYDSEEPVEILNRSHACTTISLFCLFVSLLLEHSIVIFGYRSPVADQCWSVLLFIPFTTRILENDWITYACVFNPLTFFFFFLALWSLGYDPFPWPQRLYIESSWEWVVSLWCLIVIFVDLAWRDSHIAFR